MGNYLFLSVFLSNYFVPVLLSYFAIVSCNYNSF